MRERHNWADLPQAADVAADDGSEATTVRTKTDQRQPGARQAGRRSLVVPSIAAIVVLALVCGSLVRISMTPGGPLARSATAALPIPDSLRQPMAIAAQSCSI